MTGSAASATRPVTTENAEAPNGGAKVQITVLVLADGTFQPQDVSAAKGLQPFADAVSYVLRWWRSTLAVDSVACAPKAEAFSLSIWFEGRAKEPHIYVTISQKSDDRQARKPPLIESISTPDIDHPRRLARGNVEGTVTVLTQFGTDGTAMALTIVSSTPFGAFDSDVSDAARLVTVKWKSPPPLAPVCAHRTNTFCLEERGRTPAPFSGCRH